MSSPITGDDFDNQSLSDSLCSRFQEKLLNNDKLKPFLNYLFNADGTIAATFATDLIGMSLPIGFLLPSPIVIPGIDVEMFLRADGQQVLKSTYARLFAAYGTVFNKAGDANTETYFRVPDLRSRFFGGDGTGGGAEANIGATAGSNGGAKSVDVTLTSANIAPHKHDIGVEGDGDVSESQIGRLRVGAGTEVDWEDIATTKVGHTRMTVPTVDVDEPTTPITIPTIPPAYYGVWYVVANFKIAGTII